MTHSEMVLMLCGLNRLERKRMNAALRILMSVEIDQFTALEMILVGIKNQQARNREFKQTTKYSR